MRRISTSLCVSILFFLAVCSTSRAQGIAAGSGEASGAFGYAHVNGVASKNHLSFGGSGLYNLNPIVAVGFEYNYTPLGSETISGITGSEHLQTYGGVARFSLSKSSHIVPYALVGFGDVNGKAEIIASPEGVSASASQNGFYFAFGGGATIFAAPRWGIRPEFRYERQQFGATNINGSVSAAFGENDIQATVSVFYQFGGRSSQKH
jgi:opacity protein-like surface antigen